MSDRLPDVFSQVLTKYSEVSNYSGSCAEPRFKDLINVACQLCEKAMEMVNELHLFSNNESLDDLSSVEIRYMCLPAILGYFNAQQNENRISCIRLALSLYKDFFKMCTEYSVPFPAGVSFEKSNQYAGHFSLSDSSHNREVKIARYKSKRALDERLDELASYVDQPHTDEETKREFSLTLVQRWLCVGQDDIISLQNELELLSKGNCVDESDVGVAVSKPFRPFIITRSAAQSSVFGAGYPSLPTLTIEQFYDQQVAAGLLPPPKPIPQNSSGPVVRLIDPSAEEYEAKEKKKANQDELEDADDPDMLSKARSFDDFKDEHRRGSGNRMNRA
ncbi:Immunoglobulin-binding protein 1b [Schistosoma japonicum]|nr:Immunoglobulin-binding protein 1b [Schistosoma japonicum]KAH8873276.1 Immunoglobulin-binding protein 1b [Schistosoma japonicum]KAH8873277.1 Immunoglobulin-binding protein 1b [Schistosoma japonicum]